MNMNELNAELSAMNPTELAMGAGLAGAIGMLIVIFLIATYLLSAAGYYKMFKKAGQRGWFAFIPLLREYGLFKMAWTVKAFVINVVLLGVFQITSEKEGAILALLTIITGIAWLVMQVKLTLRTVKAFGKGAAWALLLFFVPYIGSAILGFGKAEYIGVPTFARKSNDRK